MKVNLPVRWKEAIGISEDEKLTLRALDRDDSDEIIYTPGFLTVETKDIRNWNGSDDGCVTIRTYEGDAYSVMMPHDEFDNLWTNITGENVMQIRVKEKSEKKTKKI